MRRPDHGFSIKANVMSTIKELCELHSTKLQVTQYEAGKLIPVVFACSLASEGGTARELRRESIWTLSALLEGDESKMSMIDADALQQFNALLRSTDAELRRGAGHCVQTLASMGSHVHPKYHAAVRSHSLLRTVIDVFKTRNDTDFDLIALGILNAAVRFGEGSLGARRQVRMMVGKLGGIEHMLDRALTLVLGGGDSLTDVTILRELTNVLLLYVRGAGVMRLVIKQDHMRTFMELARSSDSKVRRGGATMLSRISTLPEAKQRMVTEEQTLPLLLSMVSPHDYRVNRTTAKVLAELSEAWQNRVPLVNAGVLSAFSLLIGGGESKVQFECARALGDISEAVENRSRVAHEVLADLQDMLASEDLRVVWQSLRCLLNLVAPAGEVGFMPATDEGPMLPSDTSEVGRFGLSVNIEYGEQSSEDDEDDDDGDQPEQVQARATNGDAIQQRKVRRLRAQTVSLSGAQVSRMSRSLDSEMPAPTEQAQEEEGKPSPRAAQEELTVSRAKAKLLFKRAVSRADGSEQRLNPGGQRTQREKIKGLKHRRRGSIAILDSMVMLANVSTKGNDPLWWQTVEGSNFQEDYNSIALDRIHQKMETTTLHAALIVANRTAREGEFAPAVQEMSHKMLQRLQERRKDGKLDYDTIQRQMMRDAFQPVGN
eukprot:SAG22_NODE_176_length_16162_cov_30.625910_7_plen_659_part_00